MYTKANRIGLSNHLRNLYKNGLSIIVFPDIKLVFMKIPRTAGTSVHHTLIKNYRALEYSQMQDWMDNITDAELDDYLLFSFVRNPWDRVISVAKYFYRKPKHIVREDPEHIQNGRILKLIREHMIPCHEYTINDGKSIVDYVFRFENLQEHFDILCDHIGLERVKLPTLSRSRNNNEYRHFYSDNLREEVAKKYAKDIEVFGYEF